MPLPCILNSKNPGGVQFQQVSPRRWWELESLGTPHLLQRPGEGRGGWRARRAPGKKAACRWPGAGVCPTSGTRDTGFLDFTPGAEMHVPGRAILPLPSLRARSAFCRRRRWPGETQLPSPRGSRPPLRLFKPPGRGHGSRKMACGSKQSDPPPPRRFLAEPEKGCHCQSPSEMTGAGTYVTCAQRFRKLQKRSPK